MFKSIEIHDWRQFSSVKICFHDKLTVLTGANGAGKTTILNLLNRHFGWNLQLVGTPRSGKKGVIRFFSDLWKFRGSSPNVSDSGEDVIGKIVYGDDSESQLSIPHEVSNQYQVNIPRLQSVPGLFISSHRPVYFYQKVTQIPTSISASGQLLENYLNEIRNRYNTNYRVNSASYRIKEALISLATLGYGNQVVARNEDAISTFEGFEKVLSRVLPTNLGFRRILIRMPEVVLDTSSGEFSFDAVSGGISAIIDMSWQLHMASKVNPQFVVVIDEPENHLHPTLQKTLLPNFVEAFPNAQFIIATHNPFMVGSVPDSNVYVLDYDEEKPSRVVSTKLDLINKAASSSEILREALGLSHTKPVWVEQRINELIEKYGERTLCDTDLKALREDMKELKLDHLFPETVLRIQGQERT
ncbi:MAG: AAA family ATPase [Gammaproteobacteria bacterium]|nr:AAA family ATPase [Gammaproteobacteria bacterium]